MQANLLRPFIGSSSEIFTRSQKSPVNITRGIRSMRSWIVAVLWIAGNFATPSHAQANRVAGSRGADTAAVAASPVKAVLTQHKVVPGNDGVDRFDDASKINPGDVIEYRVTYTNTGEKQVTGLVANLPVPPGLQYVAGSASPAGEKVEFAATDGNFGRDPLVRKGTAAKPEKIPYAEYRHIRWTLGPLAPHGSVMVLARAQVEKLAVPQSASVSQNK